MSNGSKVKRQPLELTAEEKDALRRLLPQVGQAFSFWKRVCKARDLDYRTLLWRRNEYTALPLGHGTHWCWPANLRCSKRPTAEGYGQHES